MSHWPALAPEGVYLFIFIWLFVESTGFQISDEPVLLLAGSLAASHQLNISLAIAVAAIGKILASCLAYLLGRTVPMARVIRPAAQPAGPVSR